METLANQLKQLEEEIKADEAGKQEFERILAQVGEYPELTALQRLTRGQDTLGLRSTEKSSHMRGFEPGQSNTIHSLLSFCRHMSPVSALSGLICSPVNSDTCDEQVNVASSTTHMFFCLPGGLRRFPDVLLYVSLVFPLSNRMKGSWGRRSARSRAG